MKMETKAVTILFCGLLLNVGYILSYDPSTCIQCRKSHICVPPKCFCCRDTMPLPKQQVPQMVFFSFDDAVNPTVAAFYRKLFDSKRLNPNGCPISMTLFVSHRNTVYKLVEEFYEKGYEIASHSVTHAHMNPRTFIREAKKQKDNLSQKAKIPIDKITGWRSPFLEPVGDIQPSVLKDLGYEYDATLTITKKNPNDSAITPFTLDFGWPYDCKIKSCPSRPHKGFWEVPVVSVKDYNNKYDCVYVDGCAFPPPSENLAYKFLWDNFQKYYATNRAPMGINMHASWFYYPDRLKAMDKFIKDLVAMDDVYIVSIKQVIEWLKNPTPLSQLQSFQPWSCDVNNNTVVESQSQTSQNVHNPLQVTKPPRTSQQWNTKRARTSRPVITNSRLTRPPLVPNLPMVQFWWRSPADQQQRRIEMERNLRQQEKQREEARRRRRTETERQRRIEQENQAKAQRLERLKQEQRKKEELARQAELRRQIDIERNRLETERRQEMLAKRELENQKKLEIEKKKMQEQQAQFVAQFESLHKKQQEKEKRKVPVIAQAEDRHFPQQRAGRRFGTAMNVQNVGSRFSRPVINDGTIENIVPQTTKKVHTETTRTETTVTPKPSQTDIDTIQVLENTFNLFISRKLDEILKFPPSQRTEHLEKLSLDELRALQKILNGRLTKKTKTENSGFFTNAPNLFGTASSFENSPLLQEFHEPSEVTKVKIPARSLNSNRKETFGVPYSSMKAKTGPQNGVASLRQQIVTKTSHRPVTASAVPSTSSLPPSTTTSATTTQKPTTAISTTTTLSPTTTTTVPVSTTVVTTSTAKATTTSQSTTQFTTTQSTTRKLQTPARPLWLVDEDMANGQMPWHKWITKLPAFSMVTSPTTKLTTRKQDLSVVKLFSVDNPDVRGSGDIQSKPVRHKPNGENEIGVHDHVSIWKYTDPTNHVNDIVQDITESSIDNGNSLAIHKNMIDVSARMPDITMKGSDNKMPDMIINTNHLNEEVRTSDVASNNLNVEQQIIASGEGYYVGTKYTPLPSVSSSTKVTTSKRTPTTSVPRTSETLTTRTTTSATTSSEATRASTKSSHNKVTANPSISHHDIIDSDGSNNSKLGANSKHIEVTTESKNAGKNFVIPKLSIPRKGKNASNISPSWFKRSSRVPSFSTRSNGCQQEVNCMRPNCVCKSESAPSSLNPNDIPQIVYITMDGSLNFHTFGKLRSLFSSKRINPNGCKIKGTAFVTDTGSSYRIANVLENQGLEIALMGRSSRPYKNAKNMLSDIELQRKTIAEGSNISPEDVKGWRSPGFTPVGDEQYSILSNLSLYDSSIILPARVAGDPILWPHTLDYGWRESCQVGDCPNGKHPGVWEVPILPYLGPKNSTACEYLDGCTQQPANREETLAYLRMNFNSHYLNGKAPFAIRLKQVWFHWYYRENFAALLEFLDEILSHKDVYIISVSDTIEWMKAPVSLKQAKKFKPWQC